MRDAPGFDCLPAQHMTPDAALALCSATAECAAVAMAAPGPAPSIAVFKSAVFWQQAAQGQACSASTCVFIKNRGYGSSAAAALWSASLKGRGFTSIPSLRVQGQR